MTTGSGTRDVAGTPASAALHPLDTGALRPLDVAARLPRVRERLADAGVDALVVTRVVNIRYLTGFSGSAAVLLVGPDDVLFVTDGRYGQQAREQLGAAGVEARVEVGGPEQRDIVSGAARRFSRIGLEAHGVTWAQQRAFAAEWFPHAEIVATEGLVEDLRRVKDAGEVDRIRAACSIGDRALRSVLPLLSQGEAERDIALALEIEMRRLGASGPSFETIVAGGPNGAKPHARPSARRVGPGELVVLDFGCVVDGYCSDMTRTVAVGDIGVESRRMHDVVIRSQAAGRAAVRAGVACADVDRACREVISAAGLGDAFVHSTGHGVGLEIHEAPWVRATSGDTLAVGHVVTVEPGVYLGGLGGVRIEDTVVVTEGGCEPLTESPRDAVPGF